MYEEVPVPRKYPLMIRGIFSTITSIPSTMYNKYIWIIVHFPLLLLLLTLIVSIGLSITGIVLHRDAVDFTPSKGFETRGTKYSDIRLSLEELPKYSATRKEIFETGRKKRELLSEGNETVEDFTVNYSDYGVNSHPNMDDVQKDACVQYAGIGTEIPYEYMDLFAKMTFEVRSIDELFTLSAMKVLCKIDSIINSTPGKDSISTKLHFSYNLALYSTCLNFDSSNTCDALNEQDIQNLKKTFVDCKNGKGEMCDMKMIREPINYLLPIEFANPFYFNVILPLYTVQENDKEGFQFFMDLKAKVQKEMGDYFTLRGTYFFTKDREFLAALPTDCILAGVSALLVFIVLYCIVRSLIFTIIVCLLLILSFGVAFFIYTVVLSFPFFPFVNLLSLALMISLAADDAFVLVVFYREEVKTGKYRSIQDAFIHSLSHSLTTVTVTSITTAIAFLVNLSSNVLIMRCFGIFASLVVFSNLILLIFLLPSCLFLCLPHIPIHIVPPSLSEPISHLISRISSLFYSLRYLLCVFFSLLLTGSIFIVFISPSLQLPQNVNVQLLHSFHSEEWFDSHSFLFNLSAHRSFTMIENVVYGVNPIRDSSPFNPNNNGQLTFDDTFSIDTVEHLRRLKNLSTYLLKRSNRRRDTVLWVTLFWQWLTAPECNNNQLPDCCIGEDPEDSIELNGTCFNAYSRRFPISSFPSDWTTFPIDGPIFDKQLNMVGYFFDFPSNFKWSLKWNDLQEFFKNLDELQKEMMEGYSISSVFPAVSTSTTSLRIYDLLVSSLPSTLLSLAIALSLCLVLVLLSTRSLLLTISTVFTISFTLLAILAILVLLGWRLGVIESSIIILATGVAFDYVLHYSVAYRMAPPLPFPSRIRVIHSSAGSAVAGGTATALAAAIPLLFSTTSAFSQLGTFLLIVSIISFISSTIVFPAFHSLLHPFETIPKNLKF